MRSAALAGHDVLAHAVRRGRIAAGGRLASTRRTRSARSTWSTALAIDGTPVPAEQMAVLTPGAAVTLTSGSGARAMLLGGDKIDGERFIEWNFVASSREAIERAKEAWTRQEMGKVPGETEWIPLPESKPR